MLTIKEFAEIMKIKPRTAYKWIYEGKIKIVKIGRTIRIPEEEIERLKKSKFAYPLKVAMLKEAMPKKKGGKDGN